MSIWRQMTRGLRVLGNRRAADQQIDDEINHYLEEATSAFVAQGFSPEEARRAALLELGNVTTVREQVRGYGWENMIDTAIGNVRYAVRRLCRRPGFAATSLLTLTLGIGATIAIFSVINGVLLKPLSYPEPERLVGLRHTAPGANIKDLNLAASLYYTYSEESRVFQDVAMWTPDTVSITGVSEPEEAPALAVTNRFLPILGTQPALGRAFTASDDAPQSERVAILSNGYWMSRFGGDRSVLGRRITLDEQAHEVIGVMPPSFEFMDRQFSILIPLRMNRASINLLSFCCQGFARLKPGVTLAQANEDVARMLAMAPAKFPLNPGLGADVWTSAQIAPRLRYLKDVVVGDIGNTLWVLMSTVGMMLLIAYANVANLFLVRTDERRHELTIRAALGAGWGRIAGEILLESLLLSITGGALGLALAYGSLRVLSVSELIHLPRIHDISIDPMVLAFTIGISLAGGLLFGLIPVLKYARPQVSKGLRIEGRSLSGSRERGRARNLLVILQVALAFVLLVGAGLMIRTFQALRHIDPGFSAAHEVETLRITIPETQVMEEERAIHMEEDILHKIEAVGGVSRAALTSTCPMEGGMNDPILAEDRAGQAGTVTPVRRFKWISPGYFATIGARLVVGRDLTWAETYNRTPVALVSENLARELWGDARAAIGKRIRPRLNDDWRKVIGVVADLRDDGIDQNAPSIVYWPLLQKNFGGSPSWAVRSVAVVIRTPRAGSSALLQDLKSSVSSVNPNLPLADVKTLQSIYDRFLARTSVTLIMLALAGGMALLLSVIGLYGVISYSVSQRTREIGIRLALGAPLKGVTGMFVRHGLILSSIGVACGLTAALAVTRLMGSLLYDVSPADPLTYVGVAAGLIVATAFASYLPARVAARVDPVIALRVE
jgi:predicted permease